MSTPSHINGKPVVRCSGLDQLLSCPGSRTLVAELGSGRGDDRDSWEGSMAHYEAALRLVNHHGAVPPEGGLVRPDIPLDYKLAPHAERVVDYYVRSVLQDAGGDMAIEVESELLAEFDQFWLSGHCDFSAVNADATELRFNDLKTGILPVDVAEQNYQIAAYCVLFKRQWPTLTKVVGRIVQPRIGEAVGPRESEVTIEGEQLEGAAAFLEKKINDALANPMQLETNQKSCRWCEAALRCPALAAERDIMKMQLTKEEIERLKLEPEDQALARWCVAGKLLSPKFDAAKEILKERLAVITEIVTPEGVRLFLETKPGVREVVKKQEAWHRLAGHWQEEMQESDAERWAAGLENTPRQPKLVFVPGELDESQALECVKFSVGEVEKQLAAKHGIPLSSKKGDCGKARAETLLEGCVERSPQSWLMIV